MSELPAYRTPTDSVTYIAHLANHPSDLLILSSMEGFLVFDYSDRFSTAYQELSQWLAERSLQRKETVMKGWLAVAEQALGDLYKGINTSRFFCHVRYKLRKC
jgi:NADPH-dependent curcumin reductase CurA